METTQRLGIYNSAVQYAHAEAPPPHAGMRPFLCLDSGTLQASRLQSSYHSAPTDPAPPNINLTRFKEFVKRRMAGIVHTAGTIGFLHVRESDPVETKEADFIGWMRDAIIREHSERRTDVPEHTVTRQLEKDASEYKRVYNPKEDQTDTWISLLLNTDTGVRRMVTKWLRSTNQDLASELQFTLCTDLMQLCYDFMVNIWVHVGTNTVCSHHCEVLYRSIKELLDSIGDSPVEIVKRCEEAHVALEVAAKLVYGTIDSLQLHTEDPRAIHPAHWTDRISCLATMSDGTWNERVLIERTLWVIYGNWLSTTKPLLHMQHTNEWNRLLRPKDLDTSTWEMLIPNKVRYIPLDLKVAPFDALFERLINLGGSYASDEPIQCIRDLRSVMLGVNLITFSNAQTIAFSPTDIRYMDIQLSFDLVGETEDVHTVLVLYNEQLALLVFDRQQNRLKPSEPGGRPTTGEVYHEMLKQIALDSGTYHSGTAEYDGRAAPKHDGSAEIVEI